MDSHFGTTASMRDASAHCKDLEMANAPAARSRRKINSSESQTSVLQPMCININTLYLFSLPISIYILLIFPSKALFLMGLPPLAMLPRAWQRSAQGPCTPLLRQAPQLGIPAGHGHFKRKFWGIQIGKIDAHWANIGN